MTNYTVEGDKITINGYLYLGNLKAIPDSKFLKGTTINGSLYLNSLESIPDSNFLRETNINGSLWFDRLKSIPDSNFLKGATINGDLYLHSLKSIPDSKFLRDTIINGSLGLANLREIPNSKFLKKTTINGYLDLTSLTREQQKTYRDNVKQLQPGYYPEKSYCLFDGILSEVLSVKETSGYTIYTTPFEYIAQKDNFTAHAKTIKKAILDVEFKIVREKIKNDPIKADYLFTVEKYRMITGACDLGCRNFMQTNNIPFEVIYEKTVEKEPMTAKDLMKLLEQTRPYGYEKIKSLIIF